MRKIKEIIRLKFDVGLSLRAIQQSLNISYGTVSNYNHRLDGVPGILAKARTWSSWVISVPGRSTHNQDR